MQWREHLPTWVTAFVSFVNTAACIEWVIWLSTSNFGARHSDFASFSVWFWTIVWVGVAILTAMAFVACIVSIMEDK